MIFRGQHWPMWLIARRGDVGMAAFLYACLHLAVYLYREGYLENILADLALTPIMAGWAAFLAMAIPFVTSGRAMTRRLGEAWKPLQRFAYVAAILAFVHWLLIRVNDTPAYVHFLPQAALEIYRLVRRITRPMRHPAK
jgi:sulfoxide reductase heme-binding subunit YedZ